jgi:hypothetical protein
MIISLYPVARFTELCSEFAEREQALLSWKNTEYANQEDKLQNFREISALLGVPMSQVALTYMLKHTQAVKKQVMDRSFNWAWETEGGEGFKQRIADIRNYCLLLAACLEEENEKEKLEVAKNGSTEG